MVVMSAVSTAITMSMTRFSVLFVLSVMINQTHPALRAPHTLIFDFMINQTHPALRAPHTLIFDCFD